MTVYEIPNIEHCTVTEFASGGIFRIITNEGWVIKLPEYGENEYSTAVGLRNTYDFSTVQILPISELSDDAVINGDTDNGHEIVSV